MAFPQIADYTLSSTWMNSLSTTIYLPSSTAVGDLLLLFITKDGTGKFTTPTGWNLLASTAYSAQCLGIFHKTVTQPLPESFTISHASEMTSWIVVRIPNGEIPVISSNVNRSSSLPNPPNLISGLTGDIMYISVAGWDSNKTITGYPSNMPNNRIYVVDSNTESTGTAIASVNSTTGSFNPTNFTLSATETWTAYTLAIKLKAPALPEINITDCTSTKLSGVNGKNSTTITFSSNISLSEWEIRADGSGVGSGDLIGSGGALSAGTSHTVYANQLTWGDRIYRINIYGKSTEGLWNSYE